MIEEINNNVWKLSFKTIGSHVYIIKLDKIILIDTSTKQNMPEFIEDLKKLNLTPEKIDMVLLTHHHWDHIENISMFTNAKIYGSRREFNDDKVLDINDLNLEEIQVIKTPGHSEGGRCFLYKNILFSGDTLFHRGTIGRTDLPGSCPIKMTESIDKISKLKYKILCPSHGRE
ncbi:MAG: MBL fold metallo-hydrolase [archaeon]